jgi:carboxylesterase type B
MIFGNYVGGTATRFYAEPVPQDTLHLAETMCHAWTQFAGTGDPGGKDWTLANFRYEVYISLKSRV